ncbi:hypothetical protein AJ80_08875 [Polytolypa hystricis UAMH7299]|uniref:Uncharacterized protein n=1 Tax=Polytolypa hystricis (strain UAMH7299) TaxID=1447883 RepID=A0A2B7X0N6_POLH7|nr:hypothetical protein AJ80_08875 [Polytolypa hystricis UAMH7299]
MYPLQRLSSDARRLIFLSLLLLTTINVQLVDAVSIKSPRQDAIDGGTVAGRERISITLKPSILPSANKFISDPAKHHEWPNAEDPIVSGGMGRLPVHGVDWYRQILAMNRDDRGKSIYLDIDSAMSYAMVWLNSNLVSGWPYSYNSFHLDLTPYIEPGRDNLLAIRLDNPTESARWYPGGGLYQNIWLTKVDPTHIAQWGTFITSKKKVSDKSPTLELAVEIENKGTASQQIEVVTDVHTFDGTSGRTRRKSGRISTKESTSIPANQKHSIKWLSSGKKKFRSSGGHHQHNNPICTSLLRAFFDNGKVIDTSETHFGIRSVKYDSKRACSHSGCESAP